MVFFDEDGPDFDDYDGRDDAEEFERRQLELDDEGRDDEVDVDPDEMDDDLSDFADPGGNSALRAAGPGNPRNRACPTCGRKNVLTPKDVRLGYQCNRCADADEGIGMGGY